MKISFVVFLTCFIMGCASIEQSEPVIKVERKTVIKKVKRKCAPIPSIKKVESKSELDAWILELVKRYKEFAK